MTESDKRFVVRLAAIVVSALVILYAAALYQGRVQFPAELQSGFVSFLLIILAAAGPSVATWIAKRTSDRNAAETQQVVRRAKEEIKDTFHNGGGDAVAQKTVERAVERLAPLILEGDRRAVQKAEPQRRAPDGRFTPRTPPDDPDGRKRR